MAKKKTTNKQNSKMRSAAQLQRLAKTNPKVDPKLVGESMEIIAYLRKLGIKSVGFNVRGASESRLKVRGPVIHQL